MRPEKIADLLATLHDCVAKLRQIAQYSRQDFIDDFLKIESTKHLLQVSIECCLDVSNHIIASEGFRAPKTYAESFTILAEQKIIPPEFLSQLSQMARFRNRLVHLYDNVDEEEIYQILHENLDDFYRFANHVLSYMDSHK